MDNPIEQINKLLKAIDEAIADLELSRAIPGITLITESDDPNSNTIGLTFKFEGDIFASPEQRRVDSLFDQLISSMESNETSEDKLKKLIEDWEEEE